MDCPKLLTDLPNENLLKIFSLLDQKDLMRIELVCRRFYNITKHPSLWKKVELKIKRRVKLHSFCDFFSKYNFIQKLQLDFQDEYKLNSKDVCAINRLFSKLNRLWCLHVKELDISNIVLPPTVTYFNYLYTSDVVCDPVKQFVSVLNCSRLESLIMIFVWKGADLFNQETLPSVAAAGKELLEKHKSSLKILHLRPLHCQWIRHISNCLSLQQLTVLFSYFEYASGERFKMDGIVKLPRLDSLVVDYELFKEFSKVLDQSKLPQLKNLSIMDSLPIDQTDFELIHVKIPNLVTFSLGGTFDVKGLLQMIDKSKSLKYFCFGGECVQTNERVYLMNKIYNLSRVRKFDSVCFCELIYKYTLIDKIDYVRWFKEHFSEVLFNCKKCYSETSISRQCQCWPEKRFKFADRFFALYRTTNLKNFPLQDEIDSYCVS